MAPPAISYSAPRFGSEDSSRAAPAAPRASAGESAAPKARGEGLADSASNIAQPAPAPLSPPAKLGTGHGARETSVVGETQFERLSNTPNEVIRIRYDSWDNLVAMGIIQPRRPPAPTPNAFPESAVSQFVADPPSNLPYGRR